MHVADEVAVDVVGVWLGLDERTVQKNVPDPDGPQLVDEHLRLVDEYAAPVRLVIDLGGAYLPGRPVRTVYQFELLVRMYKEHELCLAQEFYHYNPARLPAPAEWVNIRRIRVKDSVNVVWWLSKTDFPKADNRKVLRPYSKSMENLLENGYDPGSRPSGWDISGNFSKRNQGAIPPNVLEIANTESNSKYLQRCREAGMKPHPARFPAEFASFFIKFLTDEGDVVLDPFAGSNTAGAAAEDLHRRWVSVEKREDYLEGSKFRFSDELDLFPLR